MLFKLPDDESRPNAPAAVSGDCPVLDRVRRLEGVVLSADDAAAAPPGGGISIHNLFRLSSISSRSSTTKVRMGGKNIN